MLTAIRGVYDNGQIIWNERPPINKKTNVVVTFLEEAEDVRPALTGGTVRIGSLKGKIVVPEDFNEPLEDLNDYMY